jgi:adenosylcobinamide-GDP ribazoletransferase
MIRALLGAVQFLTVIPVASATAPPGRSALFFPLIGACIGVVGAILFEVVRARSTFAHAAALVLTFWAFLTGGLHEDGFADCADAFRAGRPAEKIQAILKDSRIGAHGALALILFSLIRWQSLSAIALDPMRGLAAALALSRGSTVALAWLTPPAGAGLGLEFSRTLTTGAAIAAIAQTALFAVLCGPTCAILMLGGATGIVITTRAYFIHRIGGVTGDCYGATTYIVETYALVVLTCRSCS